MSIMAKTPSGYKKIGSAYLGERPVDKVFNANGDVVYTLQRELTGVPPLLFKGKEQSELLNYRICGDTETKQRDYSGSSPLTVPVHDGELYNYRIYGNTANGESVGDRTGNLFDMKKFAETAYQQNATVNYSENSLIFTAAHTDAYVNQVYSQVTIPVALRSSCINVQPLTTYTISMNAPYKCFISWINDSFDPVAGYTIIPNNQTSYTFTTPSNCTKLLIRLGKEVTNIGDTFTISNIMLNAGSTALPYEPYGYKVPIAVTNSGTTSNETIYLPEQIKMVGSEAEYVDFYSQKQYFADGTNTAITAPALPISAGANTVTVNTTVQPSNVEVSTDENVSVGDLVTSGQHAGEYKVDVTVEGKNLWDGELEQGTLASISGTPADNNNCVRSKDFLTLSEGEYTISAKGAAAYAIVMEYDVEGTWKSDGQYRSFALLPRTINVDEIEKIKIVFMANAYDKAITVPEITEIMLNSGSTPLPYEPYHAPVTTPIYLPEPIKMVGSEAEYVDYAEQKQHRVRKNLLPTITATYSKSGIILRSELDGTVIVNGTTTAKTFFTLRENISYPFDTILSGCPQGGSSGGYCLRVLTTGAISIVATDFGSGAFIPSNTEVYIEIRIENGFECNNLEFTPMIRKADIEDDTYEPYIENTDLDVTLPALPTIKGTNVLSVGTEVQPSRMDIKGRIKSLT